MIKYSGQVLLDLPERRDVNGYYLHPGDKKCHLFDFPEAARIFCWKFLSTSLNIWLPLKNDYNREIKQFFMKTVMNLDYFPLKEFFLCEVSAISHHSLFI